MRTATATAALLLALALPACSSSDDGDAPAPAASATAAAAGGSYATTADIIAGLGKAGLPCTEPMTGTYEGVSEAQSCILNGSEDVVLLRFATPAEREDYLANKDALASAVVGENWAVQTVLPATAEQVSGALGGEVRLGEGSPTG